jgi:putative oxidoreductase
MEMTLLLLRVAVGLMFAGHGAQKLLGWFGGHGRGGTGYVFESIGLPPRRLHATAASSSQLIWGSLRQVGRVESARWR